MSNLTKQQLLDRAEELKASIQFYKMKLSRHDPVLDYLSDALIKARSEERRMKDALQIFIRDLEHLKQEYGIE